LTKESRLIRTIFLRHKTTYRTHTTCITRINKHDFNACKLSFVCNLGSKVKETPASMLSPVGLSNRYSVSDTLKVLKCNTKTKCLSLINKLFGDNVINVIGESSLFALTLFQKTSSRFSAFLLQFLSDTRIPVSSAIQLVSSVLSSCIIRGDIDYAEINSKKFFGIIFRGFRNVNTSNQIEDTVLAW